MSDEKNKSSWLEPLPEEFVTAGDMTTRRLLIAAFTVVLLTIFGGLIWYSYLEGRDSNGPVPLIRADNAVVKEKPESPGGLEVPDQDKAVFNRMNSENVETGDKLAPSEEIPLTLDEPSVTVEPQTEETISSDVNNNAQEVEKIDQTEPEVLAVAKTQGNFLIQLGAFGKKDTADSLWAKLQTENNMLLRQLTPDIMMIDLGKKGTVYRLRAGILEDRSSADKICNDLKAKKQACIVVAK
ncbi:MAG: SPOR domain-containing protein [Emcibacter sp.]|nr:SPOR domain-containing protein [Emcibacter sp.]